MLDKIGKRIAIDSESNQNLDGLKGWCISATPGQHPGAGPAEAWLRVVLDGGGVLDVPNIAVVIDRDYDATAELTAPALPPIDSLEAQELASQNAARIAQVMRENATLIKAIEADIKQEQDALAARMRGNHYRLYQTQEIIAALLAAHEDRLKAGALALWMAAGKPQKGKTFGVAQIAVEKVCTAFDTAAAVAWAESQAPALISKQIDSDRFKRAVKDGVLTVPDSVCKFEDRERVKIVNYNAYIEAE